MNPTIPAYVTGALWLLAAVFTVLQFTIAPGAINAAVGTGFWAVVGTAATIGLTVERRRAERNRPR